MRVVALLRGVNIGASKRIAMVDLRRIVEALGHSGAVGFVGDFLADLGQVVLAIGILHVR